MRQYPADRIRNVGLFSHGGAGKTSLAEALLFDTGTTTRLGRVDEGNTVTDYDPDEIKRRISVSAAFANAVAPVQFPIGAEKRFRGVVDLLAEEAYTYGEDSSGRFTASPVPDELKTDEETYRRQLVEAIAEQDEELMMRYLEDDTIATEELAAGL